MQEPENEKQPIPVGLCQCGCGQKTRLSRQNKPATGQVLGQPLRYVGGHFPIRIKIGDKSLSRGGYVQIYVGGKKRYKLEHVLLAEQALGRPLKYFGMGHPNNEVVHHVDGCKTHNVCGNFVICSHSYHVELHMKLEASDAWPEFKCRVTKPNGTSRAGRHGYKGLELAYGHWYARVRVPSKGIDQKSDGFDSPVDAAKAYDDMAVALLGANWITNKSLGLLP